VIDVNNAGCCKVRHATAMMCRARRVDPGSVELCGLRTNLSATIALGLVMAYHRASRVIVSLWWEEER
jgi:hypothetical protein